MLEMIKKFFDFCNDKNRRKFYTAIVLGVVEAMFTAMKIPAAFVAIQAVLDDNINTNTILTVIGLMLVSTLGKTVISRFSTMLQTEGGYDTAALKRIEIGEHLQYLPMGYFNEIDTLHIFIEALVRKLEAHLGDEDYTDGKADAKGEDFN